MDNELITAALHFQLKEAAQRIFAGLEIKPGNYNAADVDKALNLSGQMGMIAAARHESREYPATAERNARKIDDIMINIECSGVPNETVAISFDTFTASMPAALVFAKLVEWEREFKIKTADRAKFVKEAKADVIFSCVVTFPKEAKYIADYTAVDNLRPLLAGVHLDLNNKCIVASDTHVLTEIPVEIEEIKGEAINLTLDDPKLFKTLMGQCCTIELLKEEEKNIRIRTEKGEIFSCKNIKGNFPNYRRVYPRISKRGYLQLTKESIKALSKFVRSIAKIKKDQALIKIMIPAGSTTGEAVFYDFNTETERKSAFNLKHAPAVNVGFGIAANQMKVVTNNWDGGIWYTHPGAPLIFDNTNTRCTIAMPMTTENLTFEVCKGVMIAALERHDTDAEAKEIERRQAINREEACEITKEERNQAAQNYCVVKNVKFISCAETEITALTPNGCRARYVGRFRRSGDIIIFDCKENYISPEPPKEEPETPQISTEAAETGKVSAEEEKHEETPKQPPQDTGTDGRHDMPPKPKEAVRNAPAAPPGPPGQLLIITPTINKNLILHKHDRNNNLAPPHLHNRGLCLPRLFGRSGYNLRNLYTRNFCVMAACQVDRQASKQKSRGSPHRAREGDR